ncbi:MAG: PAS domain S-box protein [Methanomicrobiales archaeon]|nr:PAS domain S-box protein [Methanomicrobiales archaeon]
MMDERSGRWRHLPLLLIALASLSAILVSFFSLFSGITIVFQNLFYIPIILSCYYYPRRGLIFSFVLTAVYVLLLASVTKDLAETWLAIIRSGMFIAVAFLVSYLSDRLNQQMARYQSTYASSEAGIFLIDSTTGSILDVNTTFSEITGYPSGGEVSMTLQDLFPDAGDMVMLHEMVQKRGTFRHHEIGILTRDGYQRIARLSGTPLEDPLYMCSVEDVTERRKVEQALLLSEQRLLYIINFLPDATFAIDRKGTVIAWNRAIEGMTGTPATEMMGEGNHAYALSLFGERRRLLADLVLAPDETYLRAHYSAITSDGDTLIAETSYKATDGTEHFLWVKATPLHGQDGAVAGAIESMRDITHIRNAERAIRESEEKFRGIFETAANLILVMNPLGIINDSNPQSLSILGYSRDELVGRSIDQVIHPLYLDQAHTCLKEILTIGHSFNREYRMIKKSGELIDVLINSSALKNGRDTETTIICLIDDITDRKAAEEAISRANRQLNILSSITRHDILNALTALAYYQERTREIVTEKEPQTYLEKQELATRQIQRLIEFTRDYQDLGSSAPLWQSAGALVMRVAESFPHDALKILVEVEGIEVLADPLFEKVFYSLVENAVRHGERVTQIRFSYRETVEGIDLVCEDNGVGIPAKDKVHIFKRGFGKHTGLGLFLSKEILAITGLTIRETGLEGSGARFEIHVPRGKYRIARTTT